MEVPLILSDETLTLISTLMEVGIAAAEEFNHVDHGEWRTSPGALIKAKKIVRDLDEAVIYDYIIQNMGVEE